MTKRIPCKICGIEILPTTYESTGGQCMQCNNDPSGRSSIAPQNPIRVKESFNELASLIEETFKTSPEQNLGLIGDAFFETFRIYSAESLKSGLDYDNVTELAEETSDELEEYSISEQSLLKPLIVTLKSIAKELNEKGKLIFFASWGMGPTEIGFYIYYLNSSKIYEDFIKETGFSDSDIMKFYEVHKDEL